MKKLRKAEERSLFNYVGSIGSILRYQIVSKFWLFMIAAVFESIQGTLLWTTDRSAITSGDLPFLMRSVQGWGFIVLCIIIVVLYVAVDINAMIILSSRILHQEKIRVFKILVEATRSLKLYFQPFGFVLLLYVAVLVPIVGAQLGISLTSSLYIPDFILSVIVSNKLYNTIYILLISGIYAVGLYYIFTFHYIVLGKEKALPALKKAGEAMRKNWKVFIKRYLKFFIFTVVTFLATVLVVIGISSLVDYCLSSLHALEYPIQFKTISCFLAFLSLLAAYTFILLFPAFHMITLTRLYESFTEEDEGPILFPKKAKALYLLPLLALLLVFLLIFSYLTALSFDDVFPSLGQTEIIVHRAGGNMANENTVLALNKSIDKGAYGAEFDIQRTKDGHYIINHDDDFFRLAGVDRTAQSMTLAEIKQLEVPDNFNLDGEATEFATFEEMLDAADGKTHLYAELKGATADEQMADDLYRIVKDRDMLDQVTFICLNYPLISYMEKEHPDADTGYLCFAAFGELSELQVDQLILEEETATPTNIDAIHKAGKKVSVWTVNNVISMLRFYSRNVDAIITDEVEISMGLTSLANDLVRNKDNEIRTFVTILMRTAFVLWP